MALIVLQAEWLLLVHCVEKEEMVQACPDQLPSGLSCGSFKCQEDFSSVGPSLTAFEGVVQAVKTG